MNDKLKLAVECARKIADQHTHLESPANQDNLATLVSLLDDALDMVVFIETEEHLFANRDTRADTAQARWDLRRSVI